MGLDVVVAKLVKIPDNIKTFEELICHCANYEDGCMAPYSCDDAQDEEAYREFPAEFTKELPAEYCDVDSEFAKKGLNKDDYQAYEQSDDEIYYLKKGIEPADAADDPNNCVVINVDACDMCMRVVKCFIRGPEVGYQRRGANEQFYTDGKWDTNIVVSKKEVLLEDWKKYFSDTEEDKKNFKRNIIDNFVEGETVVFYI